MSKHLHYLVVESSTLSFASEVGGVYRETDAIYASRETLIRDIIDGQYEDPIRVVAFDPSACDVSEDIAKAVSDQAWSEGRKLPDEVIDFCEDQGITVPEIRHV